MPSLSCPHCGGQIEFEGVREYPPDRGHIKENQLPAEAKDLLAKLKKEGGIAKLRELNRKEMEEFGKKLLELIQTDKFDRQV